MKRRSEEASMRLIEELTLKVIVATGPLFHVLLKISFNPWCLV